MFNRRYRNEYEVVINEKTGKKELKYIGDYYRLDMNDRDRKQRVRMYLILMALIVVLYVLGLFWNNDGSRIMYVMIPYACAIFSMCYLIMGVIRTAMEKGDMEHFAYDCSVTRIKKTTISNTVIIGVSFIGDVIFMAKNWGVIDSTRELLFAVTALALSVINYYFRTIHAKTKCTIVANKSTQENISA